MQKFNTLRAKDAGTYHRDLARVKRKFSERGMALPEDIRLDAPGGLERANTPFRGPKHLWRRDQDHSPWLVTNRAGIRLASFRLLHFLWFTAFVGANLAQSAFTRWCLMEDVFVEASGGRLKESGWQRQRGRHRAQLLRDLRGIAVRAMEV